MLFERDFSNTSLPERTQMVEFYPQLGILQSDLAATEQSIPTELYLKLRQCSLGES